MSVAPPPPKSKRPQHLGFTPQPMVQWFAPGELVRAGIKALLSSLFGAYADYREVQAALREQEDVDLSDQGELWIDYVADTGDGFDSTYTIARLVAEEKLTLRTNAATHETERGRILVFGGDQVYPTAKNEEYHNRLVGPYRAALPWVPDERVPWVYAIPGNHDWYDGLTSFTRLFCQGRWLGAWKSKQKRSYWAIKLAADWWLWGLDVQLGSDIDLPQLEYFKGIACDEAKMPRGSKVIVCVAEPVWVFATTKDPTQFLSLAYFQKRVLHQFGHCMVVGLSGDLHTYTRYQLADGQTQCFVAGGGGAYLYPSHDMPETLSLPVDPRGDGEEVMARFEKKAVFPDAATSRKLTWGSLLFPFKNWQFSGLLASLYLFYAWVWQSVSLLKDDPPEDGLMGTLAAISFSAEGLTGLKTAFTTWWETIAHSPGSVLLFLVLVIGLVAFADRKTWWGKARLGLPHAAAHTVLLIGALWVISRVNLVYLGCSSKNPWQSALFAGEMLLFGGLGGGLIMGLYLLFSNRFLGAHTNDVFSCQGIADYKHFLRLHLKADGTLTIYPIGVEKIPKGEKGWRLNSEAKNGEAWLEPAERPIATYARLLEEPIVIKLPEAS